MAVAATATMPTWPTTSALGICRGAVAVHQKTLRLEGRWRLHRAPEGGGMSFAAARHGSRPSTGYLTEVIGAYNRGEEQRNEKKAKAERGK